MHESYTIHRTNLLWRTAANVAFLCVKNGHKYQWKMLNHNKCI